VRPGIQQKGAGSRNEDPASVTHITRMQGLEEKPEVPYIAGVRKATGISIDNLRRETV